MNKKISKILGVGLTVAMLASLLVFAAPALATISAPSVTVTPNTLSASANYTVKFDTVFGLAEGTGTITVVFPSGTVMPTSYTTNTLQVSSNTANGDSYVSVTAGNVTFTETARQFVIKIPAGATSTAPAHMGVKFLTSAGIINPGTTGSYIISVKTSEETTAVDSTAYTISTPGKVDRYNKLGNFVGTYTTIQGAIDAPAVDYDTLKVAPGTYPENVTVTAGLDYLTIIATGTAAETIIGGTSGADAVVIDGTYATLDTLTIKGTVTLSATGDFATIKNSTLSKRSSTSAATLLTSSATDLTITNSTIDTTSGTVADTGVKLIAADATAKITSVAFKLDSDTGLVGDKAIQTATAALTTATNSLVVQTSTFTGAGTNDGGIGYSDAVGSVGVVIKTSTFDKLEKAIDINHANSKATITGNTITNSVLVGIGNAAMGTISLGANNGVTVEGNTVKSNKGFGLKVTDSENVTVSGNSFSGNTLGLRSEDSVNSLNAKLNWWGATTGPTHATLNPTGTGEIMSDYVTFKPFLTGDASSARIATTTAGVASGLDASTTAGIAIEGVTTTAAANIVLSKLAASPNAIAPAYTPLTGAWFDVYVSAASSTTINVKFYATGITSTTQVYFYSGLQGKWIAASEQGVSGAGDFVWANIKPVGGISGTYTTPTASDLTGTPFVLVAAPAAAPVIATISLTVPAAGATNVAVTNTPFTWASVAGATSYSLVISASADLSSPITATAAGTAYTYTGTLGNSKAYYWQVTALKDTATVGKSDIATFVTAAAPVVVVVPPVVVAPVLIVSPVVGATNIPLQPILTWTSYAGATGYEVVVATDPTFAIIEYSHNVLAANTFYASEPLAYATTYYWRVRGVTGPAPEKKAAPGGAWATGAFTTIAKPVEPAKVEPTVIVQKEQLPAQIVEVPVQTPQPIPSYLLWTIILVGAVLIIALIVLIARTRRVT